MSFPATGENFKIRDDKAIRNNPSKISPAKNKTAIIAASAKFGFTPKKEMFKKLRKLKKTTKIDKRESFRKFIPLEMAQAPYI